jgi:primary-amine oxidase
MRTLKIASFVALCFALLMTWQRSAHAAEFCSDNYYVNVTLPNQARWDMCWEHRTREGIVLSKIHYTPRNGVRRLVLNQAGLAQIHVPYDDNGARYHDISDYGLGGNYMATLNQTDCPSGKLLSFNNKPVLCQQNEARGSAFTTGTERLKGNSFSLFSVSKIGAYNYIPVWRFMDDGSIEPGVGATGALQRYGDRNAEQQGWLVADNKVGIAHLHNFFWRLDFDLNGTSTDDYVEELKLTPSNGKLALSQTRFNNEIARSVDPNLSLSWRVVDGSAKNAKGLPLSYEIRLPQSEFQDVGPASEPFTQNDIYVTRHKSCELFASHNPTLNNCANNLADFVNGESLANADLVVWPSTTFYHMPRAEDAPNMDAHWSYISISPRDWHANNPLSAAADTSGSNGSSGTSGTPQPTNPDILFTDDFEGASTWTRNPYRTDQATGGLWEQGAVQTSAYQGLTIQRTAYSGSSALGTGLQAGSSVGAYDLDGGISSMRSPVINLPNNASYQLELAYYFAHLWNASTSDYLRISLVEGSNRHVLLEQKGNLSNRPANWANFNASLAAYAGKQVYILVEAADAGTGSVVEAAVDKVRIVKQSGSVEPPANPNPSTGNLVYSEDFEGNLNWVINANGADNATAGQWQVGKPQATSYQDVPLQLSTVASGYQALVTAYQAGASVGAYDLDGGLTSARSPSIALAANNRYRLQLSYYFAHLWNTTNADFLRISVENSQGHKQTLLELTGTAANRAAQWQNFSADLSGYAGGSIRLMVEAADGGAGSMIEAAVDNVTLTKY